MVNLCTPPAPRRITLHVTAAGTSACAARLGQRGSARPARPGSACAARLGLRGNKNNSEAVQPAQTRRKSRGASSEENDSVAQSALPLWYLVNLCTSPAPRRITLHVEAAGP